MEGILIQVENAQAVQNALNSFEKKIAKKIVRQAVRAGWKPLLERAKENARSRIGGQMGALIARKLQLRAFHRQKKGQYGMLVRIRPDIDAFIYNSASGQRAYIPAAIEYGHAFPYQGGGGAKKDVPAIPFMRPAMDVAVPNAPKIFTEFLNKAIAEENAKK